LNPLDLFNFVYFQKCRKKRGFIEGQGKKKLWKKLRLNVIVILQAAAPNRNRCLPAFPGFSRSKSE
jgi:hypothetical protein